MLRSSKKSPSRVGIIEFLENHKRVFLLAGIIICVIAIVLTLSPGIGGNIVSNAVSRVIVPMQRGLNTTVGWVSGNISSFTNGRHLVTENEELQLEISRLQLELYRLNLAAEENVYLHEALNMQQRFPDLPTMGARIIAHDPNNWHRSFHIDRGINDGVEEGMAIIATGGLAGVIRDTNPRRAQFVSVYDTRFAAAVVAARTGDSGILRGDIAIMGQGFARMDHITADAQIMPGDEIVTSPHSAIFPEGLFIGEVVSIHPNPDGITRHAIIRPAATIAIGDMVLVITENFSDGSVRDEYTREHSQESAQE